MDATGDSATRRRDKDLSRVRAAVTSGRPAACHSIDGARPGTALARSRVTDDPRCKCAITLRIDISIMPLSRDRRAPRHNGSPRLGHGQQGVNAAAPTRRYAAMTSTILVDMLPVTRRHAVTQPRCPFDRWTRRHRAIDPRPSAGRRHSPAPLTLTAPLGYHTPLTVTATQNSQRLTARTVTLTADSQRPAVSGCE
jgi:hypothetical protein